MTTRLTTFCFAAALLIVPTLVGCGREDAAVVTAPADEMNTATPDELEGYAESQSAASKNSKPGN